MIVKLAKNKIKTETIQNNKKKKERKIKTK